MSRCAVVLLAACGRLGFDEHPIDARPDAPPCTSANTHDEDRDGIVDDCDVCPHRADPAQIDGDGDRVGDECDPEADNPRQRLVVFDPFTSIASWTPVSQVVEGTDSVKLGGAGAQGSLRRSFVPATDALAIGVRTGEGGAGQQILAIILKEVADGPAYYCELYDDGDASIMFTYTFDGQNFVHPDSAPIARLANGGGIFVYEVDPTDAKCRTIWNDEDQSTALVQRPTGIDAQVLALYAENVEAEVEFFAQVRTDP